MPSALGSADLPLFSCSQAVPTRYLMLVAGQIRDTVDSHFLCSGNPGAAPSRVAMFCIVDARESK